MEYITYLAPEPNDIHLARSMGDKGWELVTIVPAWRSPNYIYWFKKQNYGTEEIRKHVSED